MLNLKFFLLLFFISSSFAMPLPSHFSSYSQENLIEECPVLFPGCYLFQELIGYNEFKSRLNLKKFNSLSCVYSIPYNERFWNRIFWNESIYVTLIYPVEKNNCCIKIQGLGKSDLVDVLLVQDAFCEGRAPGIFLINEKRLMIVLGDCFAIWDIQLRRCIQIIHKSYKKIFFSDDRSMLCCSIQAVGSNSILKEFDIYRIFNNDDLYNLTVEQIDYLVRKNNERFSSLQGRELVRPDIPLPLKHLLMSVDPRGTSQRIYSIKEICREDQLYSEDTLLTHELNEGVELQLGNDFSLTDCGSGIM